MPVAAVVVVAAAVVVVAAAAAAAAAAVAGLVVAAAVVLVVLDAELEPVQALLLAVSYLLVGLPFAVAAAGVVVTGPSTALDPFA